MNLRPLHFVVCFVTVIVTTTAFPTPAAAEDDLAKQLKIIRAAYTDQVTSIDSLAAELLVHSRSADPVRTGGDEAVLDYFTRWASAGNRRKLEREIFPSTSDPDTKREWYSCDGESRVIGQWDTETGELLRIQIKPGVPDDFIGMLQPDHMIGVRLEHTADSIATLLASSYARVVGEEPVNGANCWKVDLGRRSVRDETGGDAWHYAVWLDPAADYLPRRIVETFVPADAATSRWRDWSRELLVRQFSSVSDGIRGNRWFPAAVTIGTSLEKDVGRVTQHTDVWLDKVRVNTHLDESLFELDVTPGASVVDYRNPQAVKRYVAGNEKMIDQILHDRVKEIRAASSGSSPAPLNATPQRESWFVWMLSASLLSLLLAVTVRWRRSHG